MNEVLLGFHGTTVANAEKILQEGRFKISADEDEWLGEGVYFFENDIKQAYYWCVKERNYKSWAILKGDIKAEIIFDLTLTDHWEEFLKILKEIEKRYKKRKDGTPRKLLNFVVLNIIYKQKPYDVVRAVFDVSEAETPTFKRTNIKPVQIQLCVRNHDCIRNIERMECKWI
ncbi:MAG: hypothetical protein LRZ99_00885 [Desulfotomaculum sp.]|nr:hypothetical protein [Desulfotomaculum sp.]